MPGIARINIDSAGGTLTGVLAPTVFINSNNVAALNCAVQGHGINLHASPNMAQASSTVFAEGVAICRAGDAASCGHTTGGSANVFAN